MPSRRSKSSPKRRRRRSPLSGFFVFIAVLFLLFLGVRFYQQNFGSIKSFKISEWTDGWFQKKQPVMRPKSRPVPPRPTASVYYPDPGMALQPVYKQPIVAPKPYVPPQPTRKKLWKLSGRPWGNNSKIVFVIDDLGNNRKNEALFRLLGNQITYSILPRLPYSTFMSHLSLETKAEVILHQPMESELSKNPGPGLIRTTMSAFEIQINLEQNLATVPQFSGSNNHMGSLGSQDRALMTTVLQTLKNEGAFFLDSFTTPNIVSPQLGVSIGIPILVRDVFLDNVDDPPAIRESLNRVRSIARSKGMAIAIGHDRKNTLTVLLEDIPKLESEGFQIVSLGDLIEHSKNL